jgi:ppGpp synthetase/RelA/SpoT-type nucleotidyltranferase
MAWSPEELKSEYDNSAPLYNSLCEELSKQIEELLRGANVALAVPLEARVKTLESILDKCERNGLEPEGLGSIADLAGLRVVVLFRRDAVRASEMIRDNFDVLREEDTADRLAEDQFGYGSIHFEVTPSEAWLKLPTLRNLKGLTAEIQLRTASQHIWAQSSHVLQYKRESHVPAPIRRSINRAAALLETVDLEFERVLAEREEYTGSLGQPNPADVLDADLARSILDDAFPAENRTGTEDYGRFLDDLTNFGIGNAAELEGLIRTHWSAVKAADSREAHRRADIPDGLDSRADRWERGIFFSHVGLARQALILEVGDEPFSRYRRSLIQSTTRES